MAYFFFTKDILKRKPIPIFELSNHGTVILLLFQILFTHANINLAQREFGYKPTTDLQMGLNKFVRWYEKYYGSGKKSDH
ncbi:putative UDP-glucuronate 4-epimerase [Helianthus debilis subsp. tardiflorus]